MKTQSAEFKPTLAAYQHEAAVNPAKLFDLANWQIKKLSSADALGWLQSLPMQIRTNRPASLLAAQCQMLTGDWRGLQPAIQQQNWSELEFIRHAFLARALRQQNLTEASTAEWGVALQYAGQQKGTLSHFSAWRRGGDGTPRPNKYCGPWWNKYPEEKWATSTLSQALITWHRTRSLMELFDIMFKRNPADLDTEKSAMTAMLLGAQGLDPYDLAREVYEKAPANPSFASTYAFSLYLQRKFPEALKVIQRLTPKDLRILRLMVIMALFSRRTAWRRQSPIWTGLPRATAAGGAGSFQSGQGGLVIFSVRLLNELADRPNQLADGLWKMPVGAD